MNEPENKQVPVKKLSINIILAVLICGALLALPFVLPELRKAAFTYSPVNACNLFTIDKAQKLIGENINPVQSEPTINTTIGVATSKCSYSDLNVDNMAVASFAVHTAVTDKGVDNLKENFEKRRNANETVEVDEFGKNSYFIPLNGQLHILDSNHIYIFSRFKGEDPAKTDTDKLIEFAKTVKTNW